MRRSGVSPTVHKSGVSPSDCRSGVSPTDCRSGVSPTDCRSGVSRDRPEWTVRTRVPANHPSLPGHFPGNPVVPAVLLLDQVLVALRHWRGSHWQLRRLVAAKFVLPLRPDQDFEILLRMSDARPHAPLDWRLDWRCERDARVLAQGSWVVSPLHLAPDRPPGAGVERAGAVA